MACRASEIKVLIACRLDKIFYAKCWVSIYHYKDGQAIDSSNPFPRTLVLFDLDPIVILFLGYGFGSFRAFYSIRSAQRSSSSQLVLRDVTFLLHITRTMNTARAICIRCY
jgi:hypothetical protein